MSEISQEQRYLQVASKLAQVASDQILALHKNPIVQSRKADHSPVTEADLRSDEILRSGLSKAFPDHGILSEETGVSGDKDSEFVWLIDPLDGTKAYAKGIPGFCVMVGLLRAGNPILGVVMDPLEGRLYEAIRGQGAYQTFQGKRERLRVSARNKFEEMPLVVSTGFPEAILKKIQSKLRGPILDPINSVGIKSSLLSRGNADIYINHHAVNLWDTCAPQVILEEAGGVFTKLDGSLLQYSLIPPFSHLSKTLANNGKRHTDLVKVLAETGL